MAQPLSLKAGNFLSLGKFFFQNILKDDYSHKKFEVESYNATTTNNNPISYKIETVKTKKEDTIGFQMKDELKFGKQLWGDKYLQIRVKRDDEIKYHLDLGTFMLKNIKNHYFAAIKTNMRLENFWTRFGIGQVTPLFQFWNRIEKNFQGDYSLSSCFNHQHGPFYFGISEIYNFSAKKLQKFDMVCNYNLKGFDLTFQHLAIENDKCKFPLGKVLLAGAYQINKKYAIAAWLKKNLQTKKNRFVLGVQSNPSEKLMLKAKTDCNLKTSLSSKYKICSSLSLTMSTQIKFKDLIQNGGKHCLCTIPFGYSLDISI